MSQAMFGNTQKDRCRNTIKFRVRNKIKSAGGEVPSQEAEVWSEVQARVDNPEHRHNRQG